MWNYWLSIRHPETNWPHEFNTIRKGLASGWIHLRHASHVRQEPLSEYDGLSPKMLSSASTKMLSPRPLPVKNGVVQLQSSQDGYRRLPHIVHRIYRRLSGRIRSSPIVSHTYWRHRSRSIISRIERIFVLLDFFVPVVDFIFLSKLCNYSTQNFDRFYALLQKFCIYTQICAHLART